MPGRHSGRALCVAVLSLLAACGSGQPPLPFVTVQPADLEFTVKANGELIASEALPVAIPPAIRMSFNIAWMIPEFSDVREGEVIARFDDAQVRLDRDSTALNVAKADFKLEYSHREGALERVRIDDETVRVDGERVISETFASADQTLLSRNEIIDALADVDYLDVEGAFLQWQMATLDQRNQAERNLIRAERQGELSKLEKQDTALGLMELRSPADGTFVYARTPWGEKLGKGKTVHPGMPVGLLPVRGKVAARLYVPETDAVGLAVGQAVRLRLDAVAEHEYSATVESVSPVASPRNRTDPRKFFVVDAVIDAVDADVMRVGSHLRAEIVTGAIDGGIAVPSQAVYGDAAETWVYVLRGGDAQRRTVTLGRRGPDRVEVTQGLEPGERVSLVAPAEAS